MEIPNWIDIDEWEGWITMREEKKYPRTENVFKAVLRKLEAARREGHDPNLMLNNSTIGSWQGVFANDNTKKTTTNRPRETMVTNIAEVKVDKVLGAAAFAEMKERAKKG